MMISVSQFIALLVIVFGVPACVSTYRIVKRGGGADRGPSQTRAAKDRGQSAVASHPSVATEYDYDHEVSVPNHTQEFLQRIARGETI